jgi:hypothetical protein
MPPDKAKELTDMVAKTDGIIFSLWPEGAKLPTGKVSMDMMEWRKGSGLAITHFSSPIILGLTSRHAIPDPIGIRRVSVHP